MAERPTNALYDYYHPAHGAGWTDALDTAKSLAGGALALGGTGMQTYGTLNLNPLLIGGGIAGRYLGGEIYDDYYNSAAGHRAEANYMDANPYGTPGEPTQRGAERDSMNLYNYGGQFWPRR